MRLFGSAAILAFVLSLLLVPATAQTQPVDAGLDIDSGIQGDARAVIARTIRNLPAEYHRGWDILYVTIDQRVFSNRVALRDTFRFLTPVGDRIYQDRRGEIVVFPEPESFVPTCDGTTGPYRRVHTIPGKGSMKARQLFLPGPTSILIRRPANETAFIMLGGWGGGSYPGRVEGGFQYSPTLANWALFLRVEGRSPITDPNPRFRTDQVVDLTFGAASVNQAYVEAHGTDVNGNWADRLLFVTDLDPNWGWNYLGDGMVLSRTTSIAQTTQNFSSGSYLKNVDWIETWLIGGSDTWHNWQASETGGTCSWPNSTKVQVTVRSAESELVSIILSR